MLFLARYLHEQTWTKIHLHSHQETIVNLHIQSHLCGLHQAQGEKHGP